MSAKTDPLERDELEHLPKSGLQELSIIVLWKTLNKTVLLGSLKTINQLHAVCIKLFTGGLMTA
ncbi:MAG: hypothetical protein ACO3NK_20740, partial [Prochlorotrichaceae cyanobacterium]